MAPATPFDVQGLNIAYFGRPADPNSLTAWGDAGFSPEQIVLEFVKTSEYQDAVAPFILEDAVDFTGLIDLYYTRLVGRNATISEISGWTEAILSGDVNFDYLGITIANAVLNLPDGTDIKDTLQAKLNSANIFSLELAADPDANAAYSGAEAAEIGVSFLNTVTSPPAATPADAASFIAQLTAETLTLTPGIDTLSGDSGNTTFEAPAEATAFLPIQTLNNGDQLNGGGGRNTLNAQLVDVFTTPTSLANIQEVNLSGAGSLVPLLIPATLNVINANAIDTIGFRSPTNLFGGLQVINLTTALTTVNIADDFLGTNLGIQFVGAALDGEDDILDVNLTNAQESILDLDTTAGFYETVNVNSGGFNPNTFTLETNEGPDSIFVTGNTDLDIDGAGDALDFDRLRLFDAQALNANLDADFTGGDANGAMVNFLGAQGNTSFFIDATSADADLMITTFGGDDDLDVNDFSGNITADLGEGTNNVDIANVATGSLAGDVSLTTGDDNDTFAFTDVEGNVTVVASNGTNTSTFRLIGGNVTASGGDGLDTFTFFSNVPNGEVAFGEDDSVDGGDGDEDRLRIETGGNTNRDLLVPNVGPNIVGVEIIEHFGDVTGNSDLNVDMSRSGSAFILELRGTYSDDVDVTGLDFESGDVVRLFSDIDDDLDLSNAPLSVGGFRLEMNGVTIGDDLDVGTGTADVVRILSTGLQSNIIDEANDIDARIEVRGDANINIGSTSGIIVQDEYNLDGGLIDARGLNARLRTFLGTGEQTVNDSLGADQIWSIRDGSGDNDTINLSEGDDVVGFDGTNASGQIANQDLITGFVINEDTAALKVGNGFTHINLEQTNNAAVSNGEATNIRDVVSGDTDDLSGSTFNFLKFTTAADSTTVNGLFDAAIGAGSLDVVRGADLLGAAYDTGDQAMVLFRIDNGNTTITSSDDAEGISTIKMSYDDFLAFEDIAFVDSYLTTI
ncbi:hypothetical protein [Synechococcus sp. BMK-MC-1]|uniref:beta strand repeat-containing protein n=1 Tax=Synechococcus sp. BMK-MC-1 TaxID=1442551 RepID=UPI001645FFB1|nr:hypothetical protein [Synechococcus sp. BMK-MC-1]QNI66205.1 hypothetical protein SynBMKMC1_00086 [Synechococcus sp. BMK-MC-1]